MSAHAVGGKPWQPGETHWGVVHGSGRDPGPSKEEALGVSARWLFRWHGQRRSLPGRCSSQD